MTVDVLVVAYHSDATKHFGSAMTLSLRVTWLAADLLKLLRSLGRSGPERSRPLARLGLHLGLERRPVS